MEAATHIAYTVQQHLDRYEAIIKHTFDKHIQAKLGEVIFAKGQLVQVYHSNLDYTFKTERKLVLKWLPPY
jgi:hypothetical protein